MRNHGVYEIRSPYVSCFRSYIVQDTHGHILILKLFMRIIIMGNITPLYLNQGVFLFSKILTLQNLCLWFYLHAEL